jgi:hypothetical protein
MASKNQTRVAQGSTLTTDIFLYAYSGGALTDADSTPTYVIKNPDGDTVYTDFANRISIGYYTASYDVPADATISEDWSIEWTIYLRSVLVPGATENFIVVESGLPDFGDSIVIEDKWMRQIKRIIGFPKVTKLILTDDEIKELCVEPALREYFKKFPKRLVYEQWVNRDSKYEIAFPAESVFGVIDARITDRRTATVGSQSSFWELIKFQQFGGSNITLYGVKGFNPNALRQSNLTQFQGLNAYRKTYKTEFIEMELDERKLHVYTNQEGTLQVDWALWSNNFEDVRYQQIENVIKLSQSYVLRQVADLTGLMTDADVSISMNAEELKTKADDLREKVFEEWNEITDIVMIKM